MKRPAKSGPRHTGRPSRRRTTLTLPTESLARAERIARTRNVNLSAVVSEALVEGLRAQRAAEHGENLLEAFRKPFEGFSDEEMMILDGIILEPPRRRK